MTDSVFKLKNPPIIEAVLDIECDLPPNLKIETLKSAAQLELGKSYPKVQSVLEHQFQARLNESPELTIKGGVVGLQFRHSDEKQVVQFRAQGFSFNRLAPYTSLDAYLPQIKKAWTAYVKLASPVQIRIIRLRYINRILLPFVNGRIEMNEHFQNGPHVADEKGLTLIGFLNQYTAVDVNTGYQVNSVLTAQAPEDDNLPVIFDNSAMALETMEPENWTAIRSKIIELRQLKNRIFRNTLTETCLNRYQQS